MRLKYKTVVGARIGDYHISRCSHLFPARFVLLPDACGGID